MLAIQLDLFKTPEECERDALRLEIATMQASLDKVRKGTYSRINVLNKSVVELTTEVEIIKRNICKGSVSEFR